MASISVLYLYCFSHVSVFSAVQKFYRDFLRSLGIFDTWRNTTDF